MVTISVERAVPGPPGDAYYALTHAAVLHDWLCDFASVSPRPGGPVYLRWHDSTYVCGEFLSLDEDRSVALSWRGPADAAPGRVAVRFSEVNAKAEAKAGTTVAVDHEMPDEDSAGERAAAAEQRWTEALGNLAYLLETGLDRRTQERPLLGIYVSDFNPVIARTLGVPVIDGMRLDGVSEGLGADAAGLRKDDVLVEMAGLPLRSEYGSVVAALHGKRGGDRVEVVYYRGPERRTATMELSRRPVPEIPRGAAALAEAVKARRAEGLTALEACLGDVDDEAAGRRPADGGWNAREVLAHLVQAERATLGSVVDLVGGHERVADDDGGNLDAAVQATVSAFPTVAELMDELRRLAVEAEALAAALPPEFVARTCTYVPVAQQLLDTGYHVQSHVGQIEAAVRGQPAGPPTS